MLRSFKLVCSPERKSTKYLAVEFSVELQVFKVCTAREGHPGRHEPPRFAVSTESPLYSVYFFPKCFFWEKEFFWENLSLIILDLNNTFILSNLYINLACLSVCLSVLMFGCLFVCLYPINVKTAKPIGPKFLSFMNDQNFKYLSSSTFDLH